MSRGHGILLEVRESKGRACLGWPLHSTPPLKLLSRWCQLQLSVLHTASLAGAAGYS